MKSKNLRKMQRAIINSKALRNKEAQRLTDMQGKVFESYDPCKGFRDWRQERRTAMAFAGRSV